MKKLTIYFVILMTLNIFLNAKNNDNIVVSNGYIRLMPPMMKMTAAFMDIKNLSSKSIKIVKVSSDLSEFTEIHTHKLKDDGTAVMSQLKELVINANSVHSLKKGADHIMFIGLKKRLVLGDTHKLKLYLDNGTIKEINLEIKKF